MIKLFYMFAAHALCDYAGQGQFMSDGKNHLNPLPGVPWYQCLLAHSLIHGGAAAFITGNLYLGLAETVVHFLIDYTKSSGKLTFNEDQFLHYFCKIVWFLVLISY